MAPYINSLTCVPRVGFFLAVTRLRSRTPRIPRHLLWECRGTRECQSDPRLAATDANAMLGSNFEETAPHKGPHSALRDARSFRPGCDVTVRSDCNSTECSKSEGQKINRMYSLVSCIRQHIGGSDRFKTQIKLMSAILICSLETTCHVNAPV